MKKIIVIVISFMTVFSISVLSIVEAVTYSKTATNTVTVYTAKYKTSEKATYHPSGDTRWSYSNHSLSYVSGTSGKGVTCGKPYTSKHYNENNVQYTYRTTKVTLVDSNYQSHSVNSTRSWKFNTSKSTFQ